MITAARLRNFQSHADTNFRFHPGINAIVGPSDKGKSAIIRAIRWVAFNSPAGMAHISDWSKTEKGDIRAGEECRVTLEKDGRQISRIRSKDLNAYAIDSTISEAVKTEVPSDVSDLLNIGEVNLQSQMDSPFLISATPGEVARFFNRTIKLEDIDQALTAAESRKRDKMAEIKLEDLKVGKLAEEIQRLDWVDEVLPKIAEAQELQKEQAADQSARGTLLQMIAGIRVHSGSISQMEIILAFRDQVTEARALAGEVSRISGQYNGLKSQIGNLKNSESMLAAASLILTHAAEIRGAVKEAGDIRDLAESLGNLDALVARLKRCEEEISRSSLIADLAERVSRIRGLWEKQLEAEESQKDLRRLISRLAESEDTIVEATESMGVLISQRPETCPTCGAPMGGKASCHTETN